MRVQLKPARQPREARPEGPASLLAAALALPGLAASMAHAEAPPEQAVIAFKYLDYRDWQPGESRMQVHTEALALVTPVGEDYGFAGNYSADSISGASPLHHNTLSGASGMVTDYRQAGDVRLARYFSRASVGLRAGVSTENDYFSRAAGVDGTFSTADNNTTYAWGIGGAADRINSVNGIAVGQTRHTTEYLAGITQALTPASLVQVNLTYARGHGYYSDPYKLLDHRPDTREQTALLVRYRYYVDAFDAVLRTDYRFYRDTWDLRAHTIDVAWDQNLPHGWSVTPSLRYYWQNAASFYHDPPYPSGFTLHGLYSADTRLSAFGALAPAIKVAKEFGAGWSADARLEFYRQRSGWYPAGDGSPGLETFSARSIIAGVKKTF